MAFEDKRRARRFDVQIPVRVRRGDEEVECTTQNLSRGGMLTAVPLDPVLEMGDRVHLEFSVPQLEGVIDVEAEVRWRKDTLVGLQFVTGLRAKHTWALGKFLEMLAKS